VENRGVGNVERNTVDNTMTPKQAKNSLQEKTIIMPFVVEQKRDLKKMNIVEAVAQAIVPLVGRLLIV
jgi:hypothetical protein